MPLHAQCKAVLDAIAAQGGKPIEDSTPAEVRASRARNAEAMAALAGPEQPSAVIDSGRGALADAASSLRHAFSSSVGAPA